VQKHIEGNRVTGMSYALYGVSSLLFVFKPGYVHNITVALIGFPLSDVPLLTYVHMLYYYCSLDAQSGWVWLVIDIICD